MWPWEGPHWPLSPPGTSPWSSVHKAFLSPFSLWCTSHLNYPFPTFWSSKGNHSIFSYLRRNSFHMCLIHLRLLKVEISASKTSFNFSPPCPFLETGSCVWPRTNSSNAPGIYKMFGMRNGEVWGRLLYSLPSWARQVSARGRLGSSWGWKTSQNFPVSPHWAQGLRESMF